MTTNGTPLAALAIDPAALKELVKQVVAEALVALEADRARLDGQLAYSEAEAARLLGLNVWVLRGERRRGRIAASRIVGSRIRYTRDDLLRYLAERRLESNGESVK
jgi:helix-turn-helix protein